MSNSIETGKNKPKFSVAIQTELYKNLVNSTLNDPQKAKRFIAAISSAVSANPALQECDAGSILSGGLLGEGLGLSPSPQLGQYYLVPFNDTKKGYKVAQFQLGYKGYIQLALRSGYYKQLNVIAIKKGELVKYDILTEEITLNIIEDDILREATPTMGYYAWFEYQNGFKKSLYWSKEKMLVHADKYSAAFDLNAKQAKDPKYNKVSFADFEAGKVSKSDIWLYSSFWYKNFDGMAYKTMLRQLISKWGVMSTEMQDALDGDMTTIQSDGTKIYVETEKQAQQEPPTQAQADRPQQEQTLSMDDL